MADELKQTAPSPDLQDNSLSAFFGGGNSQVPEDKSFEREFSFTGSLPSLAETEKDAAVELTINTFKDGEEVGLDAFSAKRTQIEEQQLASALADIATDDSLDETTKIARAREVAEQFNAGDLVQTLAAAQEDLDRESPRNDKDGVTFGQRLAEIRERRVRNAEIAAKMRDEQLAELPEGWNINQLIGFATRSVIPGGELRGDQLEQLLVPDFYPRVAGILADVTDDNNIAKQLRTAVQPADQLQAMREALLRMDEEGLKETLSLIRDGVEQAGLISDGDQQKRDLLLTMLGGIEFDDPVSGAENIFAVIEMAGLGSTFTGFLNRGLKVLRVGARAAFGVDRGVRAGKDTFKALFKSSGEWNPPTPEITPGSAADTASRTKEGAERLINAATGSDAPAKTAKANVKVEEVLDTLVLPKHQNAPVEPSGAPFIETDFLPNEVRGQLTEAVEANLNARLPSRPKDSRVWIEDGNFRANVVLGKGDGLGYSRKDAAQRVISKDERLQDMGAQPVEADDGTWFIAIDETRPVKLGDLEDVDAKLGDVEIRGIWRRFVGKAQQFTNEFVKGGNIAFRNGLQQERELKKMLEPFTSLSRNDRGAVFEVLERIENNPDKFIPEGQFLPSRSTLEAELGSKRAEAAMAVFRSADRAWHVENNTVRQQLDGLGFRTLRETKLSGEEGPEFIARPFSGTIADDAQVRNMDTGTIQSGSTFDKDAWQFFEVVDPDEVGGARFVASPISRPPEISDLPSQVVGRIKGYVGPRIYKAPIFIDKRLPDGRIVAAHTAPTRQAAEAFRAKQKNPDDFILRLADEVSPDDGHILPTVSDQYRINNRLSRSQRKEDPVTNITPLGEIDTNNPAIVPMEERIQAMVSSAKMNAGIRRWTSSMEIMWNNQYGDLFDSKFSLGRTPRAKNESGLDPRVSEALAVHRHVRMMNGLTPKQTGVIANDFLLQVSDGISTFATKVDPISTRLGNGARVVANQLSGLDPFLTRKLKSIAFTSFMSLNPVRMAIMQRTMIPLYMAVDGAPSYIMKGRFFRDQSVLGAVGANGGTLRRDSAVLIGRSLGMSKKESLDLIEDFERSSLAGLVDNHIFNLGDTVDFQRKSAWKNTTNDALSRGINASKAVGFDAAVMAETRTAWLLSRNRWIQKNGRRPTSRDDFNEIDNTALNLTLNQNPSDTLVSQNGSVSLLTQFMSHQIKMTGRMLSTASRLLGGRGDEAFTTSELVKMSAINLAVYGFEGWGFFTLGNKIVDGIVGDNPDVDQETVDKAKLLVGQGLAGGFVDGLFNMGLDRENSTQLAFSSEFGPTNFFGSQVKTLAAVAKSIAEGGVDPLVNGINLNVNAPVFSLVGGLFEALKTGAILSGNQVDIGTGEQALFTIERMARKFPLSNNILKSLAITKLGTTIDSAGRPGVEANKRAAIAALAGIDSSDDFAMRQVQEEAFGEFDRTDDSGFFRAISDQAKEDARNIYMPLLRLESGFGAITFDQALDLIHDNMGKWKTLFADEDQYQVYANSVAREFERLGITKTAGMQELLMRQFNEKQITFEDARDLIRGLPFDPKTSEQLVKGLEDAHRVDNFWRDEFEDLLK